MNRRQALTSVLAASAAVSTSTALPLENKKDIEDIPKELRREVKFVFAKTVEDVLKVALCKK